MTGESFRGLFGINRKPFNRRRCWLLTLKSIEYSFVFSPAVVVVIVVPSALSQSKSVWSGSAPSASMAPRRRAWRTVLFPVVGISRFSSSAWDREREEMTSWKSDEKQEVLNLKLLSVYLSICLSVDTLTPRGRKESQYWNELRYNS